MAITKVSRGLLNTGIEDNSNATALTIDSDEDIQIGPVNEGIKLQNLGSSFGGRIVIGNAAGANTLTNSLYIEKSTQYDYLMEFKNSHANGQGFMLSAGHGSSYLQFQTLNYDNTIAGIRIRGNGDWEINAGYGSFGKAYAVRAWATFDGNNASGTPTGGNVSSFTRTATGRFTINMSTALPDTNYAITGFASQSCLTRGNDDLTSTTTAIKIECSNGSGSSFANPDNVIIMVVR